MKRRMDQSRRGVLRLEVEKRSERGYHEGGERPPWKTGQPVAGAARLGQPSLHRIRKDWGGYHCVGCWGPRRSENHDEDVEVAHEGGEVAQHEGALGFRSWHPPVP